MFLKQKTPAEAILLMYYISEKASGCLAVICLVKWTGTDAVFKHIHLKQLLLTVKCIVLFVAVFVFEVTRCQGLFCAMPIITLDYLLTIKKVNAVVLEEVYIVRYEVELMQSKKHTDLDKERQQPGAVTNFVCAS